MLYCDGASQYISGRQDQLDRLQRELAGLDQLSAEAQEELAVFIEALRESQSVDMPSLKTDRQSWQDPAGAWSDLPDDDEVETFYRMRHETSAPTPVGHDGARTACGPRSDA